MLTLPSSLRVFAKTGPTDMRKSFEGLVGVVERELGQQVESGDLFLFFNRRSDRVKVLWFSGDGLVIWYKKQETEYHRNLVFTGFAKSANNGGSGSLEVGRMVSHSSEPCPRRRPMPYDTEVQIPPRA
jgi:hypothetical protein